MQSSLLYITYLTVIIISMNTNLQVPITQELKTTAIRTAKREGFSSLQEVVRVMLTKYSKGELQLNFVDKTIALSPTAEKRYQKMDHDFEDGLNSHSAGSVEDLKRQLYGDQVSSNL